MTVNIGAVSQIQTPSPQQTATPQDNSAPDVWPNRLIAFFTFVLAVVSCYQFKMMRRQADHMRDQLVANRDAAAAAKTSADMAHKTLLLTHAKERAYIDMSHAPPGLLIESFVGSSGADPISRQRVRLSIGIKNYGNTPGTVTARLIQLHFADGPLPSMPPYDESLIETLRVPAMKDGVLNNTSIWNVESEKLTRVRSEQPANLYVIGYVDYMDQFGGRHRAGYARVWDPFAADRHSIYVSNKHGVDVVQDQTTAQNNLPFVTEMAYNYDRARVKGEGNDWE